MTNRNRPLLVVVPALLVAVLVLSTFVVLLRPTSRTFMNTSGGMMAGQGVTATSMGVPTMDEFANGGTQTTKAYDTMPIIPPMPQPSAGVTAAEVDQKIIKNGSLGMVVDDVAETVSRVTSYAAGHGGFVQDSSVSERDDGTHYGAITARVPSTAFEAAMAEIKTYATLVKTETANGQDVTEQYTDLQAQLRNAQAQEAEYLKILEKADNVQDILAVQSYLSSVRSQIESLQGRIQYLENVTSYSTITVALSEEPTLRVPTKEFRPLATAEEAFQALIAISQNLFLGLIRVIIIGGGILIPTALVVWLIVLIAKKILNGLLR